MGLSVRDRVKHCMWMTYVAAVLPDRAFVLLLLFNRPVNGICESRHPTGVSVECRGITLLLVLDLRQCSASPLDWQERYCTVPEAAVCLFTAHRCLRALHATFAFVVLHVPMWCLVYPTVRHRVTCSIDAFAVHYGT